MEGILRALKGILARGRMRIHDERLRAWIVDDWYLYFRYPRADEEPFRVVMSGAQKFDNLQTWDENEHVKRRSSADHEPPHPLEKWLPRDPKLRAELLRLAAEPDVEIPGETREERLRRSEAQADAGLTYGPVESGDELFEFIEKWKTLFGHDRDGIDPRVPKPVRRNTKKQSK